MCIKNAIYFIIYSFVLYRSNYLDKCIYLFIIIILMCIISGVIILTVIKIMLQK